MLRFQYMAWTDVFSLLVDILIAYVLALPIGWNREAATRGGAGIRTFPIVAMASCGFVLIGIGVFGEKSIGLASILYGLIVGIGFIGSGTIFKSSSEIRGNTTAASIWVTGAIGAATGFALYDIAFVMSLVTFITLRMKSRL
ncbi:MAG: MgtC/SapB family protein [Pirellulales bacterium]|nr:MgtC/SapB family protein [Pirellulales bacterium]